MRICMYVTYARHAEWVCNAEFIKAHFCDAVHRLDAGVVVWCDDVG